MHAEFKFEDVFFAVFNLHVNDAGKRAMRNCRKSLAPDKHGMPELEDAYKNGIMAIFQRNPSVSTELFANTVFYYANGLDKQPRHKKLTQRAQA